MKRTMLACLAGVLWLAAPSAGAVSGCGLPPPDPPPDHILFGGERRDVIVAVPEDYDPDRPYRLILAFHGRTNDAERVRRYYRLEQADDGGSLFVYPQAVRQRDGTFIWRRPQDVALVEAIIDGMAQTYCIDREQVFAVGHSLGASFANTLACVRGDLIRAIGSVAGGIGAQDCQGEVAALLLHHPDDQLVPVEAGQEAADRLRIQNEHPPEPVAEVDWFRLCHWFGPVDGANPVVWCLHDQATTGQGRTYPHQWPPGTAQALLGFFDSLPEPD